MTGRPPVCRCGRIGWWTGVVRGPENSQMLADWYSMTHVVHGLLLYAAMRVAARGWPVRWRLVAAALAEAGWEAVENSPAVIERYRAATIAWGYAGDSILNSVGDALFALVGFVLAWRLRWQASVAIGLGLEALGLAVMRDDLTLNVLMLVHPIAAVRAWQG